MVASAVAGEEPAVAAAAGLIVGDPVVLADLAPVPGGMAIEQCRKLVMGNGTKYHSKHSNTAVFGWVGSSALAMRTSMRASFLQQAP